MINVEENQIRQSKILFICDEFAIGEIFAKTLEPIYNSGCLKQVTSLRLFSHPLTSNHTLIIYHDGGSLENALTPDGEPQRRTLPGILEELTNNIGFLGNINICVIGFGLNREVVTLLLEFGVSTVFALSEKDGNGLPNFNSCLFSLNQWIDKVIFRKKKDVRESIVSHFLNSLEDWSSLSQNERHDIQDNALKILGDTGTYSQLIAKSKMAEDKSEEAKVWLERALVQNPNALEAQNLLAYLHLTAGRFEKALELFQKSNLNNNLNAQRLTAMGECYFALQKLDMAEKILEKAIKIDPFCVRTKEILGKVKWSKQDYTSASQLFAFIIDPKDIASFLNRQGIALVEQKKYAQAIQHYKWAQKVLPSHNQSHLLFFNMGLAYIKAGQVDTGKNYFKLALSRKPGYQRAVTLLNRIDRGENSP